MGRRNADHAAHLPSAAAGRILGLVAPGGREDVRKVLKGLPR